MRLVRNTTPDGKCKYALIRLDKFRKLDKKQKAALQKSLDILQAAGILEYAGKGDKEDAFVIKLKDRWAYQALLVYAKTAEGMDSEFAKDVEELAYRSFKRKDWKMPD